VSKYSAYFSHSWRPQEVDLNQEAWRAMSAECNLLVDEDTAENPPYFISRIEQYIRRSDLFVAILTHRDSPSERVKPFVALAGARSADCRARCSEASLFEVRLAERARKPRLVLYDPRTKFVPGSPNSALVRYAPFEPLDVLQRRSTCIADEMEDWLRELRKNKIEPRHSRPNQTALLLLGPSQESKELAASIRSVLEEEGYTDVREVLDTWTDAQVVSTLQSSSLLVADIAEAAVWDLYAMAHALFVPTIRLARSSSAEAHPDLPWLLRGHPYGYQADLVRWTDLNDLSVAVQERAVAMRDTRRLIDSYEVGRDFLERRRFPGQHRVFISHNLKGEDLPVIDGIVAALRARTISCWEYSNENRSGEKWPQRMKEELSGATHGVVVLSHGYDSSTPCDDELSFLVDKQAILLPFFHGDRNTPNPKIDRLRLHIERLHDDPVEAGKQVAARVVGTLTQASVARVEQRP
jgi:hypothetical protein